MLDKDIDQEARRLRDELAARISKYWSRNGARRHWWQRSRDPLRHEDELLIARAEWVIGFLVGRL